ncbi:DMT family transporter [Pseudomonas sp. NPDC089422]|uniref:DMT family transporter n=1 Tax=Pseudomonas sp. NPDC089422 TaxID=3364466 RepID=UPI0038309786
MNDFRKASLYMVVAYASIVIMSSMVKEASNHDVPPTETLFFRFLVGLLFTVPLIIRERTFSWRILDFRSSMVRNGAGLLSMLFMFYSLKYLPLSTAIILSNTSAFFAPLFILIFYKKKTSLATLACTVGGFAGVCILLYQPGLSESRVPYLLTALLGAVFAALAYMGVKSLSRQHSALNIIFYFFLSGTVILPFTYTSDWVVPSAHEALLLGLVGVFGLGFQLFATKAFALADVSEITPFIFINVILSAIADWILWSTLPDTRFWIGTAVILISLHTLSVCNRQQASTARKSA